MQNNYLSSFTPSLMSAETLEAIFVQREQLVEDLIVGIRESATTKNKHYRLLTGMRGIGKTHTIALIYHRLQEQADLKNNLLIAWLKEEEWGVGSWLDLQISIFQALSNQYPKEYKNKLAANVEALYQLSLDEATVKGETILKEFIGDRTLLLLTENLDEIFASLKDKGQKKFRAYLQNHNQITIVATSQSLFNGVTSKKCPFYGFFNPQRLDKLSLIEATNLLTKIAEFKEDAELETFVRSQTGKDRIKAIHHLAAGNHRVYIIFSQFLTRDSLDELVQPVMQTLDELTPYYQARMQWISPQQRKIIELLCDRRGAVPVKEIAQRCFISHQTASSQLKDLLTKGYVAKESQGRESFYELHEPLMRICLEAKKQRGEPLKLFVDFLRIWYAEDELKARLQQLSSNCLEKRYILKALELNQISIQNNQYGHERGLEQLIETIKKKYEQNKFLDALSLCELALKTAGNTYARQIMLFHIACLSKLDRNKECLNVVNKLLTKDKKNSALLFLHALLLRDLGNVQEAVKSYESSIEINSTDYDIWLNYGFALNKLNRNEEAIQAFDKAIEINPDIQAPWLFLGSTQTLLNKNKEAVQSFDKALKINPNMDGVFWNIYGVALCNSGQYKEAIKIFEKDIANNPNNNSAWFHMGSALLIEEKWQKGFEALENGFKLTENSQNFYGGNTELIVCIIFNNRQEINNWNKNITALVKLYGKYDALSKLGKGVNESIPNLISEIVSNKIAQTWLEVWQEAGRDKPELKVALRWLKIAVEYKETKGDRRVLLQLPKEERDLFETLLENKKE